MNVITIINAKVTGAGNGQIFAEKSVFGKNHSAKLFYIAAETTASLQVGSFVTISGRYSLSHQVINGTDSVVINVTQPIIEPCTQYDGGGIYVTLTGCGVVENAQPTRNGNGNVWFNARYSTGNMLPDGKKEVRRVTVFTSNPAKPIQAKQSKNLVGMRWDASLSRGNDGNVYVNETVVDSNVEAAFDPYKQASMPQQNGGYQNNNNRYQNNGNNGGYQPAPQQGGYQQPNNGYQAAPQQQGYNQQAASGGYGQQSQNNYQPAPQQGYQQPASGGYQAPQAQQPVNNIGGDDGFAPLDLSGFEEVVSDDLF